MSTTLAASQITPEWSLVDGDAQDQLERVLKGAIDMGASDIHIDLDEHDGRLVSRIRFRIDGQCRDMVIDPRKVLYEGMVSRLKSLSYCRLDESRIPQDGRMSYVYQGKTYEFRISFNPVTKKSEQLEKVVLRQMADVSKCSLEQLDVHPYNLPFFREAISLPYGFNIVTGPTGSGKTTTLYSVLHEVDRVGKNVCSIEEPIEAEVARVNQTQVRHDIGLDFAKVLRALLRQDPDVIMVGEMRDLETAETALDAALTGHVVWSTLHTNSAVASISRLIQMGIKDYMAAHALAFIFAQRLIRRLCTACREPDPYAQDIVQDKIFKAFSNASDPVKATLNESLQNVQIYKNREGTSCHECSGRGYKGRVGVMEALQMNQDIRECVLKDQGNEHRLQEIAIRSGMMTMEQYGYLKVLEGKTSVEEVMGVTK
jgi:type IV pilus assembly protein PilB